MINADSLLETLRWRYAVKSFDSSKKIPADLWSSLEEALRLTPSSYGLQPWRFLVIQNPEIREQLKLASWNQKQVTECSHYVVFTHREKVDEAFVDHYLKDVAATRGIDVATLAGFRKGIIADITQGPRSRMMSEWTSRQCYIALGNFMTSAALVGVDTCPMEGLDPAKYNEILGLEDGHKTVVACAAGYRNPDDFLAKSKKVRFPRAEVFRNY